MDYARIAVPLPLQDIYDYLIPCRWAARIQPGVRVRIPFGRRIITGFCVGLAEQTDVPQGKLKTLIEVIDELPIFDATMLEFIRWSARYYHCSLGEALEAAIPSSIGNDEQRQIMMAELTSPEGIDQKIAELQERFAGQAQVLRLLQECGEVAREEICRKLRISLSPLRTLERKGLIRFVLREQEQDPFARLPIDRTPEYQLTPGQKKAVIGIAQAIATEHFQPILLFGVTGSGKTEVYIRAIQEVVARGKEAIVLVPEIALTPQTLIRFKQRFTRVAVLHSELSPGQRAHQWQQIHQGKVDVVIGPRSAIFAPTHRLGLIVVDEEHEPSFKQQNTPRYHARDLAVKRAQLCQAIVVLGSATPSLESHYNVIQNRYLNYHLPNRIGKATLPKCVVIDMKEECQEQKHFVYFSRFLMDAIRRVLDAGDQVILFLNRRGFATTVLCPVCGYRLKCPHCDITLTYHKKSQRALCHYCNYECAPPEQCPICQFQGIRFLGMGTERIEAVLRKKFPQARLARMDSDSMTTRRRYEETFLDFSRGNIDILLGTQMIAKGLDFPKVTLVGIISADSSLQLPDFRAAERTFQLTVQVAGRAGRGDKPGLVILQTWHPEHYAIQAALKQDYTAFVEQELSMRKALGYPPFGKLIRILVEGCDENQVKQRVQEVATSVEDPKWQKLGPAPAPIPKIKDRYRWHLLYKSANFTESSRCAARLRPFVSGSTPVKVQMDIDPISLL